MNTAPKQDFRGPIELEISRRMEAFKYREPQMIAHGLMAIFNEEVSGFPEGIQVVDECNLAAPSSLSRLEVSTASKSYFDDHRRAVILERWCDVICACSPQSAASEVVRFGPQLMH